MSSPEEFEEDDIPPIRPINPSPGGQLSIENIVGQEETRQLAWRRLENGSLLLNAPRRFGKTLLLNLIADKPNDNWECLYQSFQGAVSLEDMVDQVLNNMKKNWSLWARIRKSLGQFLSQSSLSITAGPVTLAPQFRENPLNALESVLRTVNAQLDDRRLVLLWDEVPDMLQNLKNSTLVGGETSDAVWLMSTLRRWRENPDLNKISWILTGSIGFHHVLIVKSVNHGHLMNDLLHLPLNPLDDKWSAWLCECLLQGVNLTYTPSAVTGLSKITGGIAYLAHLVAAEAQNEHLVNLDGQDIEVLFQRAISNLDASHGVTHLLERIPQYYNGDKDIAEWILDEIYQEPLSNKELHERALSTTSNETIYRVTYSNVEKVLKLLTLDHYLVRQESQPYKYSWKYPPLQYIWRLRREL